MQELVVVFIHGYSVTSLETYGELPLRLKNEAAARNLTLRVEDIFLGRYISFNDFVRLEDVARALEFAVQTQLPQGKRFIFITHSTGGPLARLWLHTFYGKEKKESPMSHLIMLAPANHGSALAQLGKSRLSRLRSWIDGVEAGQGILDWLELGSDEALLLNTSWIADGDEIMRATKTFLFVLTGQQIDRKLYDHINSYTGELGSDGVVRVASANINSTYIKLVQQYSENQEPASSTPLVIEIVESAPEIPFRIIRGKSHSGDKMGIMRSVKKETSNTESSDLINSIFECISVSANSQYDSLIGKFRQETQLLQQELKIELEIKPLRNKLYIHDRYSMVLFRVQDKEGNLVPDFDLILTAENDDPDLLPTGFFADRQFNRLNRSSITYFLNYDVIDGTAQVIDPDGELVRKSILGIEKLGLQINARPADGFIRYRPCILPASEEFFRHAIKPNQTTIIDIYLQRFVSTEIFRFEKTTEGMPPLDFKSVRPGDKVVP